MTARRGKFGLAVMAALAGLWLVAASRVHVNASWSDEAWGYAAVPLFGEDPGIGDRVLFEPPEALGSPVPYLKTVRGVPGMRSRSTRTERSRSAASASAGPRPMRSGRAAARGHCARDDPGRALLPARRSCRFPRQPLCGDRPGAPRAHSRPRGRRCPTCPGSAWKGPLVGPEESDPGGGSVTILPWPVPGAAP